MAKYFSALFLILTAGVLIAAASGQAADAMQQGWIPFLGQNRFSNVFVHADQMQPQFCPLNLTNHISNTNLFTFQEQEKLAEISAKYQNVSTNSFPKGAVFNGWQKRMFVFSGPNEKWERTIQTNFFDVASLTYPNSGATEEMMSNGGGQIVSRFRDSSNNGYDVVFIKNQMFKYIEYVNSQMDGLCVTFVNDFGGKKRAPKSDGTVFRWTRFSRGKIIGKFLDWDAKGQLTSHIEFKEPFDFLGHSKDKFDLSWDAVPGNPSSGESETKR